MHAEIREILRLALPQARRLWTAIAFGVLSAGCAVALLAVSAWLITRAAEQPALMYISAAVVGVRAFALGRAFFRYLERLAGHDAAFRQLAGIRARFFARLVPLAPDGLRTTSGGSVLSQVTDDVEELQNFSLRVIQPLATAATVAIATVVASAMILPQAATGLLVMLVLALLAGTAVNRWASGAAETRLSALRARLSDRILDLVRNLDVLIAFGGRAEAEREVARASDELTRAVRTRAVGLGITTGAVSLFAGGATAIGLAVGIPALGSHAIDGPELAVIALLPLAVFEVFGMVPVALGSWRQVRSSAERLARTTPGAVPAGLPVDAVDAARLTVDGVPEVRLRGASAHWPGEELQVLSDIDLSIAPGERVLVTGPTGAGKTALAHVLTRLLDVRGGYAIDGVEVATVQQDDVRRIVGLCEQHPYLFDSDLRQNLLFARDTAGDDELLAVLDRVGLADWARSRGGLDASVGERGALISGGQAQRIALARAILAGFPVLVVDEPTANVDAEVADRIVRDILTTAAEDGRSVVLISHTDVPDDLIDRVVRLEGGRIVDDRAMA